MKSSATSNGFISAKYKLKDACGVNAYSRNKDTLTIYERSERLGEISACLEDAKSSGVSKALFENNFNQKMAVESAIEPLKEEVETEKKDVDSQVDFMGLGWGLGFGYSFSGDEAIDDAEIVDGIVRVKSNKKEQPRIVLEFHKYLWCNKGEKNGVRGCGPFVAVAATQDDLLSGVGMGFMYGFKAKPSDPEGFSIGLGAILDADVKDLADGFKENKEVPNGETAVRYKSESRWSALLFVTRTF